MARSGSRWCHTGCAANKIGRRSGRVEGGGHCRASNIVIGEDKILHVGERGRSDSRRTHADDGAPGAHAIAGSHARAGHPLAILVTRESGFSF